MAFGKSKKSKQPKRSRSFDDLDDIDYLISGEENLSADNYPIDTVDDYQDDDPLPGQGGYFDFDDDDDESAPQSSGGNKRAFLPVAIIVAIVGILAVLILFPKDDLSGDSASGDVAQSESVDSRIDRQNADGVVISEKAGQSYIGAEKGATVNGTGAILAFDYEYYVSRDGEAARKLFNPDIENYDGAYMQSHIDKVPSGTTHSLEITPRTIGSEYDVVLTLTIPGELPQSWNQRFTVMEKDGQYYVESFTTSGKVDGESQQ